MPQNPSVVTSEPRSALSKLDPDPEAARGNSAVVVEEPAPKPPVAVTKPKVAEKAQDEESTSLDLGAGFKVTHKPGSGWSTLMRVLARESKFEQVVATLDGKFDPSDKKQSTELLAKLFVRKEALEKLVRADAEWKRHCEKRLARLRERAKRGDEKAKTTMANAARVKDGEWLGNVREIISTCNGSYNALVRKSDGNKNVSKFTEAGLVFRQYPLKPKKDEPVFVMIFPARHVETVKTAIGTALGGE